MNQLDLDVNQRGWFGLGMLFNMLVDVLFGMPFDVLFDVLFDLGLLGLRLGVVDRLQILVDCARRRLGSLVDKELDSGLGYFNRYGINNHEIILLSKNCQAPIYTL